MMQVSTLYAQSLERQLVSRRSQLIQNLSRSTSCSGQLEQTSSTMDFSLGPERSASAEHVCFDSETKECTDRLCRLPSQCRSGHILGSPRRHSSSATLPTSMSHSTDLKALNNLTLLKNNHHHSRSNSASAALPPSSNKKATKKFKERKEKEAKKIPSNFMLLGPWSTRQNCQKLMSTIRSGDILEFNITLHHHWGIAIIPKNKASLSSVELVHTMPEKEGRQKVVRQHLEHYWHEGVTARINNSRDVHKHPLPAGEVVSLALKLASQTNRLWQNSEQLVMTSRYGEESTAQTRQVNDATRWGTLGRCVGLWLSLTHSNNNTPQGSPTPVRKRTFSVNF